MDHSAANDTNYQHQPAAEIAAATATTAGADDSSKTDRRQSLVAFLGAIKFRPQRDVAGSVERYFARPRPKARQRAALTEEHYWVRSAN